MENHKAVPAAHGKSEARTLWEEVFQEDSVAFLDYYDAYVVSRNRIYADRENGETVSMLHMNPYRVCVGEVEAEASYIVAVATKPEYRHQGRMRRLLKEALQEAYDRGEPFAYLMPAAEKIYQPFGFRTVSYQSVLTWGACAPQAAGAYAENEAGTGAAAKKVTDTDEFPLRAAQIGDAADAAIYCRELRREELPELAEFSGRLLRRYCGVYAKRDPAYFERIYQEQKAVNGGILLLYRGETMCGYCMTGDEGAVEVWELFVDTPDAATYARALEAVANYFRGRLPIKVSGILPGAQIADVSHREISYRPVTMARIVNLQAFLECLRSREPMELTLRITDAFLPQNNGCWYVTVTPEAAQARRLNGNDAGGDTEAVEITAEELTDAVFGIRDKHGLDLSGLKRWNPVYLNELV